ncbi:MAG: PGF-pre-PGF domain-containing protein [Candidatus Omnitrophica bacterium]|nr:PGF-pre-PGF domain-containing protein [Candidatus Omnitrophota bacterium]
MKKKIWLGFSLTSIFFLLNSAYATPQINLINITPALDISIFSPYKITTNITSEHPLSSVVLNLSSINGEGVSCWDYYLNGTCGSENLIFDMSYDSGDIWEKPYIFPDYIYPEIYFASSEITWYNLPLETSMWRRNYHLFNFTNSFLVDENMSFWVEFNAVPSSASNSNQLQVYVIGKGEDLSYFENDWRTKSNTELVATLQRTAQFNHIHTENSSHHLVALTTNSDGTIGPQRINISEQFWIVLYQDSVNINRGWDLRYHSSSICSNTNTWYIADRSAGGTWNTPVYQQGCPDMHIHLARRENYMDGITATVTATDNQDSTNTSSKNFYYVQLPNLAPNPTSLTHPVAGEVYDASENNILNMTWVPATDPNGDSLTYNISLLNPNLSFNTTLNVTELTFYEWNITNITHGIYSLMIEACDNGVPSLCTNSTLDGNFTITRTYPVYNLTSISISSANIINSSTAKAGDLITLYFNSSGALINPSVSFYSGGYAINNTVSITNSTNEYIATYFVNSSDVNGGVDFEITADNLDFIYSLTTDNTDVVIDTITPSITDVTTIITDSEVSVRWETSENTNTTVNYGSSVSLGMEISNSTFSAMHNIVISGLLPETVYYYNITCCDISGNCNTTGAYEFTTLAEDSEPQEIDYTIYLPPATSSQNYYLIETASENNVINLAVNMGLNSKKEIELQNQKNTGISKITIESDEQLSGWIKISETQLLNCVGYNLDKKIIYKTLQINTTINQNNLKKVSLVFNVEKNWIEQNNISEIKCIKCYPHLENISAILMGEDENKVSYNLNSYSFSTWVVFGFEEESYDELFYEIPEEDKPDIQIINDADTEEIISKAPFLDYLYSISAFILLTVIIVILRLKTKKINKRKNKKKS